MSRTITGFRIQVLWVRLLWESRNCLLVPKLVRHWNVFGSIRVHERGRWVSFRKSSVYYCDHLSYQFEKRAEIGGGNGVWPILVASLYGTLSKDIYIDEGNDIHFADLPAIDADWIGRAYPNLWMMTPVLYGHSIHPCAQSDARGNTVVWVP